MFLTQLSNLGTKFYMHVCRYIVKSYLHRIKITCIVCADMQPDAGGKSNTWVHTIHKSTSIWSYTQTAKYLGRVKQNGVYYPGAVKSLVDHPNFTQADCIKMFIFYSQVQHKGTPSYARVSTGR